MIRTFLCTMIGMLAAIPLAAFAADPYPARPIRMMVGYAAGGAADAAARHLATLVSRRLGQNVVIENRPGASGSIAAAIVASSPGDGYTLLYATSDLILYPLLTGSTAFAPLRDFVPVIGVSRRPLLLVAQPSLGFKSARDLVAAAKARPGTITFESSGVGSVEHLAGHLFQKLTATELIHVPYKGSAPGILALLGGQVNIGFEVPLGVLDHVKAGKLVALLTTSGERLTSLPSVPTANEEGLAGLDIRAPWGGIFAPAGTPSERVARLNAEFAAARNAPETRAHAVFAESISLAGPADAFAAFVRTEHERWSALIRDAGLRLSP
ncbi:MAG: tripartite tricarboxylate transporter substrate binding protein [Betaproteobacteria bacterium]|nr:tripartite tricarboxylate transporter substrate binding protein [Betaproteobacteria bacterium]